MPGVPETVLETEAALRIGLAVKKAGYGLEAAPRAHGADFGAARQGTTWATFHLDVDRTRPLLLRVGATVWGGARQDAPFMVPFDGAPDDRFDAFVRDRLALACRRGREQDPGHCADCPEPSHPR